MRSWLSWLPAGTGHQRFAEPLDKERRSHIDDFNCDEALGLFAGLNILPKKSYIAVYSYRTARNHQVKLLAG